MDTLVRHLSVGLRQQLGFRGHFRNVTHDFWVLEPINIRLLPKVYFEQSYPQGTDFNKIVPALTRKDQNTKPIKYASKEIRWKCFSSRRQKSKMKKKKKTSKNGCPEFLQKNLFHTRWNNTTSKTLLILNLVVVAFPRKWKLLSLSVQY